MSELRQGNGCPGSTKRKNRRKQNDLWAAARNTRAGTPIWYGGYDLLREFGSWSRNLGDRWGASETIGRPMEPAGLGGSHDRSARARRLWAQGPARPAAERRDYSASRLCTAPVAGRGKLWSCACAGWRTPAHGRGGTCANRAAPAAQNLPPRFPARKVRASQAGKTARHGDIACGPSMAGQFCPRGKTEPERRDQRAPTRTRCSVMAARCPADPRSPFREPATAKPIWAIPAARTMVGFAALNPPTVLA